MAENVFREVDEELRIEQLKKRVRVYGPVIGLLIILILLGVGGWQYHAWRQHKFAEADSQTYLTAQKTLFEKGDMVLSGTLSPDQMKALHSFETLGTSGIGSIKTLAQLNIAGLYLQQGQNEKAVTAWQTIMKNAKADPLLRSFAELMWVQYQLDKAPASEVKIHIDHLRATGQAWHGYVEELAALLDLRNHDQNGAKKILLGLAQAPDTPEGVRARASLLVRALLDSSLTPSAEQKK